MSIFKNSWVIGILTGIVSGLFVFFVTTFLFDNKKKREYALHVKEANLDIVNALKPYIAEQGLPKYQVLISLIVSTSRKYAVDYKDLLTPTQVCEELIREIIVDVYVTSEKKKEYSEEVAKFKESIAVKYVDLYKNRDRSMKNYISTSRSQASSSIALVCIVFNAILFCVMSILITIDPELARQFWLFPFGNNTSASVVVTLITASITVLTAALGTGAIIRMKSKKRSQNSMNNSNYTDSNEKLENDNEESHTVEEKDINQDGMETSTD